MLSSFKRADEKKKGTSSWASFIGSRRLAQIPSDSTHCLYRPWVAHGCPYLRLLLQLVEERSASPCWIDPKVKSSLEGQRTGPFILGRYGRSSTQKALSRAPRNNYPQNIRSSLIFFCPLEFSTTTCFVLFTKCKVIYPSTYTLRMVL